MTRRDLFGYAVDVVVVPTLGWHGDSIDVRAIDRSIVRLNTDMKYSKPRYHDLVSRHADDAARNECALLDAALPSALPGKKSVQVASARQIPGATPESLQNYNRHAEHRARQFFRFQVVHGPAYHLDSIQFVSMYSSGQAERGSGEFAIDHQDRCRYGYAFEQLGSGP